MTARGSLWERMWEDEGRGVVVVDCMRVGEMWKAGVGAGLCAFAVINGRRAGHLGDGLWARLLLYVDIACEMSETCRL